MRSGQSPARRTGGLPARYARFAPQTPQVLCGPGKARPAALGGLPRASRASPPRPPSAMRSGQSPARTGGLAAASRASPPRPPKCYARHARSKTRTSASSWPSRASRAGPATATPSPSPSSAPSRRPAPRATWIQAWRPCRASTSRRSPAWQQRHPQLHVLADLDAAVAPVARGQQHEAAARPPRGRRRAARRPASARARSGTIQICRKCTGSVLRVVELAVRARPCPRASSGSRPGG